MRDENRALDKRRRPTRREPGPAPDDVTADEIDGLAELQDEELQRIERSRSAGTTGRGSKRQRRTERTLASVLKELRALGSEVRVLREDAEKRPEPTAVEAVVIPAPTDERPAAPPSDSDPAASAFRTTPSDSPDPRENRDTRESRHGERIEPAVDGPLEPDPSDSVTSSLAGTLVVVTVIVVLGAITGFLILAAN